MTTGRHRVRIARLTRQTPDIVSLELAAAEDGSVLPAFEPGAHIDLYLAPGMVRQYSLHAPFSSKGTYEIAILKDAQSRGGSVLAHGLQENDTIEIGPPRNMFPLDKAGRRFLLMAGGIGITPLLCMAQALLAEARDFTLHYFTGNRATVAFGDLLCGGPLKEATVLHLVEEEPRSFFDAARDLPDYAEGLVVYICGPAGFIEAVRAGARQRGYPDMAVHIESFAAAKPGDPQDEDFEVEIKRTGEVHIIPAGRRISEVLLAAGADIELSCEQGMCGTCLVDLVAGEVEHRDIYQTEAEKAANERIALCCSRGRGRIVIDP